MNPDDLFKPADFPDDLNWVTAHYKLHPTDPVYLLLAWHWRRMKQSEDTMRLALLELKTALDGRIAMLEQAAETVASVNEALVEVQGVLEEKPAQLSEQLSAALNPPLAQALKQLEAVEKTVTPLAVAFATSQRRQLLAAFVLGASLAVVASVIVLLA